jgi:hypothetical protein
VADLAGEATSTESIEMLEKEEKMKTALLTLLLLIIGSTELRSQEVSLWIRLSDDRVLNDSRFSDVNDDTLFVVSGNRLVSIPLTQVVQIRAIKDSSITNGILIGSGCGLVLGGLLDLSLSSMDRSSTPKEATWLACAVLGGIVGGTIAALEKPGDLVSLDGKSSNEKSRLISAVVRRASMERPKRSTNL